MKMQAEHGKQGAVIPFADRLCTQLRDQCSKLSDRGFACCYI